MENPQLVFDIGMNNGHDTAYYLSRGYNVVAVEADPTLCDAARARFPDEVGSGRLVVQNVGVADQEGELQFWVSDRSEWSSFNRDNAVKGNMNAKAIKVPTVRFGRLIEEFGTPYFLKVDIEGNDRLCLQDLVDLDERPSYVSIEMSHEDGEVDIDLLAKLGYTAFMCVRQNDFAQIHSENIGRQRLIRKTLSHFGMGGVAIRRVIQRRGTAGSWTFALGSSGPLPHEFLGHWISHDEMLSIWRQLRDLDHELDSKGIGEWFDVHACFEPSS
jgi:FkbM family methyltransferase